VSDTSPPPTPVPAPRPTRFRPWWLPGFALGLLAALAAVGIAQLRVARDGTYTAEAILQLPGKESQAQQRGAVLLRSRDLIAAVVAEPAVAELSTVKGSADPVTAIESRLTVLIGPANLLTVTLTGNDPGDTKKILEHLVGAYADNETSFERRALDEQLRKHEQLIDALRNEIDATERTIELIGKANSTTGGEDNARRLAALQQRHSEAEAECRRIDREIVRMEAELTVLKRQSLIKDPAPQPDPNREGRVAQLTTAVDIKKEERESIRTERDAVKKLLDQSGGGGLNIDSMRRTLQPQKDALDKITGQMAELRRKQALDDRIALRGGVTTSPVRTGAERALAVGVPAAAAFAGGFVLGTGLSFVGLVFRVLRRRA
jgi:hypothetical protein